MPLTPLVSVQPGQLINLTVNVLNLSMQCGTYNNNFNYQWEMKMEDLIQELKELTLINLPLLILNQMMQENIGVL